MAREGSEHPATTSADVCLALLACRHHALSDPTRLEIARTLFRGDASATELGAALGVRSNLLAHHLNTLVDAGILLRHASEGDRRRHYLTLASDPIVERLVAVALPHPAPPARIAFVCTANSARSQLAAAQWNHRHSIPAVSAGTHPGPAVHPRAIAAARRRGLNVEGGSTRHISDTLTSADLVVAVCDLVHEELPADLPRTHWSVPDPVRFGTDSAFDDALSTLTLRIDRLARHFDSPPATTDKEPR